MWKSKTGRCRKHFSHSVRSPKYLTLSVEMVCAHMCALRVLNQRAAKTGECVMRDNK